MSSLTGPIRPLSKTRPEDRSDVAFTMWERSTAPASIDLPMRALSGLPASEVEAELRGAQTVLVAASSRFPGGLLDAALSAASPCRTYLYAPNGQEGVLGVVKRANAAADRLLTRLGLDLPADWIVADGSRGWLFVGPPAGDRRWAIPVTGPLATSLQRAFATLFWFHAAREALPDDSGRVAFRKPLPGPYADPGSEVALPVGRLVLDRPLPDPVTEADFRVEPESPDLSSGVALLRPDWRDFSAARKAAAAGARVVWSDTGLPRLSVSQRRAVARLQEGRVGLELEWGPSEALDMLHRLHKAAAAPEWTFHVARRLRDVAGEVVLEVDGKIASIVPEVPIAVDDVVAPLDRFPAVEPPQLPAPPPLARKVVYAWQAVPEAAPAIARRAALVREWDAVDEYVRGRVDSLRSALEQQENEERSLLGRLARWFARPSAAEAGRAALFQELADLGEAPPSIRPQEARTLLGRLAQVEAEAVRLADQVSEAADRAERDAADAEQRLAWEKRHQQAANELRSAEERLATLPAAAEGDEKRGGELRRERTKLETRIASLRASAGEPYAFVPPAPRRRAAPVATATAPPVPQEGPPEIGELVELGRERFLVIRTWEQLAPARDVAARLSARVVAPSHP